MKYNILKQKDKISYAETLQNTFKLITFSPNYDIAGSANLKSILYPSDVDLFDEEIEVEDKTSALNHIVDKFQNMIKLIKKHDNIFFIEFKCGIDNLSYFDEYENNKLFEQYLIKLLDNKYIKLNEYNEAKKINDFEDRKLFARSFYILRWSESDILKGFIILKNGRKRYLIDSILNDSVIKLDTILHYNYGIFIELSTIFVFKIGKDYSTDIKSNTIIKSILNDYYKYMKNNNIYKALKRAFILYRFDKNLKKCTELINYFNSNVGILNFIKNSLEIYIIVLEKVPLIKIDEILFGTQSLKQSLANITEFNISLKFYKEFNNLMKIKSKKVLIKKINNLIEKLNIILQYQAKQFIKSHKSLLL